jgi:hypothetical protein
MYKGKEITNPSLISITEIKDDKGSLTSVSIGEIPYEIKRIFTITVGAHNLQRGGHAHKECWQTIVPIHGPIAITIENIAMQFQILVTPGQALVIPPLNWVLLSFQEAMHSAIIFASDYYDESDYIVIRPEIS